MSDFLFAASGQRKLAAISEERAQICAMRKDADVLDALLSQYRSDPSARRRYARRRRAGGPGPEEPYGRRLCPGSARSAAVPRGSALKR